MAGKALHVVVLGAEGVGKTAFISKYLFKALPQERQATIEDHFHTIVRLGDATVTLDVIDTAGIEEYAMLHDPYVTVADGLVVVFSLIEKSSLDRALRMIAENSERTSAPFILVGNKYDLLTSDNIVSEAVKKQFAGRFFQTSAVTGTNVVEAWEYLLQQIVARRGPVASPPPRIASPVKARSNTIDNAAKPSPPAQRPPLDDDDSSAEPKQGQCLPAKEACAIS